MLSSIARFYMDIFAAWRWKESRAWGGGGGGAEAEWGTTVAEVMW